MGRQTRTSPAESGHPARGGPVASAHRARQWLSNGLRRPLGCRGRSGVRCCRPPFIGGLAPNCQPTGRIDADSDHDSAQPFDITTTMPFNLKLFNPAGSWAAKICLGVPTGMPWVAEGIPAYLHGEYPYRSMT